MIRSMKEKITSPNCPQIFSSWKTRDPPHPPRSPTPVSLPGIDKAVDTYTSEASRPAALGKHERKRRHPGMQDLQRDLCFGTLPRLIVLPRFLFSNRRCNSRSWAPRMLHQVMVRRFFENARGSALFWCFLGCVASAQRGGTLYPRVVVDQLIRVASLPLPVGTRSLLPVRAALPISLSRSAWSHWECKTESPGP